MDAVLKATLVSLLERWDIASVAYSEMVKFYPDKFTAAELDAHNRLCSLMDSIDRQVLADRR